MPCRDRAGHRRNCLGLDADEPGAGQHGAGGYGDARGEPAAADRHRDRAHFRALLGNLEPDSALARDHVRVVKGVDEDRAGLLGQLPGLRQRILHGGAVQHDVSAVGPGRCDFGQRCGNRHHDGRLRAESGRSQRDALRVIAGAGSDNATGPLSLAQPLDSQVSAANLERPAALEVLALDVNRTADQRGERARLQKRRLPDDRLQRGARRHYIGRLHGQIGWPAGRYRGAHVWIVAPGRHGGGSRFRPVTGRRPSNGLPRR